MPRWTPRALGWPSPRPLLACGALLAGAVQGGSQGDEGTCTASGASCGGAAVRPLQEQRYYWPMQKGDVNRTGRSPHAMPFDISKGPTWVWKDPDLDVIRATPLIDDRHNIYLTTSPGRVYKFSPDGKMLWRHQTEGNIPTVASLLDGRLFFNRRDGHVHALSMDSGRELWRRSVSSIIHGDAACLFALDGLVISAIALGTETAPSPVAHNAVVALRAADGSHAWTFKHDWPTYNFQASSPGDGTMVFMDTTGGVYRLSLADGGLLWLSGVRDRDPRDFTTGAAVVGPNGLVYAASNYRGEGIIHAYRLHDGKPVWRREMGMPVNQAVAVGRLAGSGRLHVAAGIGENPGFTFFIRARSAIDGLNLVLILAGFCFGCRRRKALRCCRCLFWVMAVLCFECIVAFGGHYHCTASGGRPHSFCGGHDLPAAFVALDAETGETRWRYTPPVFSKPSCEGDDTMYFGRQLRQSLQQPYYGDPICLPDNWAQAVIDGAGTAYGGHQDGYLYAFRDEDGSGSIEPELEIRRYYLGAAFQGSQGLAPGMLAVTPCGGGLYVWRF